LPTEPTLPHRVETEDDFETPPYYDSSPKSSSSLLSISNAMCVFAIYRTIHEFGSDPVTGQLSPQLLWTNLQMQSAWRLGMLGLSVYRLASSLWNIMG
jgi:hypothetical protein